ncbi:hypothetical protein Celaphus_00017775 [Cervus elaphus hippelaphus]|uniref:Uncharacterized protein n=1 Tax=Cervus elaphus hippelaphus TaxID=46360 RepID=A0A212C6V5_CEREH|nr:hypothetical protein Celaphus_00017775 [Cervus elaphus hippelaphus]
MVEAVILTTVMEVELWELETSNTLWTRKAVSAGELGLEGAIDNSKLNCNCITFTIWVKISGGNGDSEEELSAEVITSVFIEVYIS